MFIISGEGKGKIIKDILGGKRVKKDYPISMIKLYGGQSISIVY